MFIYFYDVYYLAKNSLYYAHLYAWNTCLVHNFRHNTIIETLQSMVPVKYLVKDHLAYKTILSDKNLFSILSPKPVIYEYLIYMTTFAL